MDLILLWPNKPPNPITESWLDAQIEIGIDDTLRHVRDLRMQLRVKMLIDSLEKENVVGDIWMANTSIELTAFHSN